MSEYIPFEPDAHMRVGDTPSATLATFATPESVSSESSGGSRGTRPYTHFATPQTPWRLLALQLLNYREKVLTLVEAYEERAALMEFEGGLQRDEAERLAWQCVLGQSPPA